MSSSPLMELKDIHKSFGNVDALKGVSISINAGECHCLLGDNGAGKSTFIKALSLSILFSQTICIVPASNFVLTPFTLINTYLNIPDCKGKESLFEAEMNRVFRHLNQVRGLRGSEYAFGVMDEIFNSTNPEEGVSGAYVIGKKLAKYKNSICLITTHFNYITKLEKRYREAPLPNIEIINLHSEILEKESWIANKTINKVNKFLD